MTTEKPIPRPFRKRRMTCKKINSITASDHGTFIVEFVRDVDQYELATLDCAMLFNIEIYDGDVMFGFEEYFTEERRSEIEKIFASGQYDDLGDLPEF